MSGYCPDCGNTQCICKEVARQEAATKGPGMSDTRRTRRVIDRPELLALTARGEVERLRRDTARAVEAAFREGYIVGLNHGLRDAMAVTGFGAADFPRTESEITKRTDADWLASKAKAALDAGVLPLMAHAPDCAIALNGRHACSCKSNAGVEARLDRASERTGRDDNQ